MTMREHPLRRQVVGEMHLRRWPHLAAPMTIIQILRLVGEGERGEEQSALAELTSGGTPRESAGGRQIANDLPGGIHIIWERHSEASSVTLFIAGRGAELFLDPLSDEHVAQALGWAQGLPGEVIRATRIHIAADEAMAEAEIVPRIGFLASDLVSCRIGGGVRLWSDFRIREDGFGCLLLTANDLSGGDLSRLVQRLQELGNYRNLALLGFPLAQSCWPQLNAVERELQELGTDVVRAETRDDELLTRISGLSLELMSVATAANYRMSATAAYAELVEERLTDLAVEPIAGFQSLVDFTQRRFHPAVRTCASLSQREAQLSLRCAQFTSLLRARIETRIENQNAQVLASMEQSATRQLRLQQLVEGLSVVAVSYYCIGLIAHMLEGAETLRHGLPVPLITGLLVLPVVLTIWLFLHRMKKKLLH